MLFLRMPLKNKYSKDHVYSMKVRMEQITSFCTLSVFLLLISHTLSLSPSGFFVATSCFSAFRFLYLQNNTSKWSSPRTAKLTFLWTVLYTLFLSTLYNHAELILCTVFALSQLKLIKLEQERQKEDTDVYKVIRAKMSRPAYEAAYLKPTGEFLPLKPNQPILVDDNFKKAS